MATNAEAIEETLSELRKRSQLRAVDQAHIQAVRSIAAALDDDAARPQLWREYRELIKELSGGHDDGAADDVAADMSPQVGNPPAA